MAETSPSNDHAATRPGKNTVTELTRMFELRRQLAEAELRSDQASTKRFAIVGGAGLIAALTGLPMLMSVVTTRFDRALQLGFPWVSATVAVAALGFGMLVLWSAWRRFRYEFLGLRESLQEVQEDLVWLRERFESGE